MHSKRLRKISRKFQVRFLCPVNRNKVICDPSERYLLFVCFRQIENYLAVGLNYITVRIKVFNTRLNKVFRLKLTGRNSVEHSASLFVSL